MNIQIRKGSATHAVPFTSTQNLPERGTVIAHINNNIGAWGKGFVLDIDKLSNIPKFAYQNWTNLYNKNIPLGTTQFIEVKPNLWVANMIAQIGIKPFQNTSPIDYNAFQKCLLNVCKRTIILGCYLNLPEPIGSGLTGENKEFILSIIKKIAHSQIIQNLEQKMMFAPTITLWKFYEQNNIPPQNTKN